MVIIACSGGNKSSGGSGGSSSAKSSDSSKPRPASEFSYDLTENGKGILIKGFTGGGGVVVVPEKIEDMPVVEIGVGAFNGQTSTTDYVAFSDTGGRDGVTREANNKAGITSIVFPKTVTKIGGGAFAYTALTKFDMPDSVTEIGLELFNGCGELTEVHLSDSIEMIPGELFFDDTGKLYRDAGIKNQVKKVNLPKNLKRIGTLAFVNYSELSELMIPDTLTSVEFRDYNAWDGGRWTKDGDINPTYSSPQKSTTTFIGCGKLPLKTRQKLKEWGYQGDF